MILTSEISIKIAKNNIGKYKLKYPTIKIGDYININVNELSKKSNYKIEVSCDLCFTKKELRISNYYENIERNNKYICKKCTPNPFSNDDVKEKIQQTLNNKYGKDRKEIRQKITNTMIERYGVKNALQNEDIVSKMKKKISNKTDEEKNKISEKRINNINKKGIEYKNKIRSKFETTMLEKYGVKNALQNVDIVSKMKEKINDRTVEDKQNILNKKINTTFNKYGVEYVTQLEDIRKKSAITKRKNSIERFLLKHTDVSDIDYENSTLSYKCEKHGIIDKININLFYHRKRAGVDICILCNPNCEKFSGAEKNLQKFIESNYSGKIIYNSKSIIPPYELDIYIPELNLAFEYDGIYWHSELYKPNNYHQMKTEMCEKINIQLIHVYEDDWLYKQDIVKSLIMSKLGKIRNKIYARNCIIEKISSKTANDFLIENHLQGKINSKINIGLFYNNELCALMSFGKKRVPMNSYSNLGEYEMLRFCNKLNYLIIGGGSKLLNYFIKEYKPSEIVSYANRSYSNGNFYEKLGFNYIKKTEPNYFYIIDNMRKYRFSYRKDILVKQGYDIKKTEKEIMLDRGILRIYDSGNLKYILLLKIP